MEISGDISFLVKIRYMKTIDQHMLAGKLMSGIASW